MAPNCVPLLISKLFSKWCDFMSSSHSSEGPPLLSPVPSSLNSRRWKNETIILDLEWPLWLITPGWGHLSDWSHLAGVTFLTDHTWLGWPFWLITPGWGHLSDWSHLAGGTFLTDHTWLGWPLWLITPGWGDLSGWCYWYTSTDFFLPASSHHFSLFPLSGSSSNVSLLG
jgi:hypothetical protein